MPYNIALAVAPLGVLQNSQFPLPITNGRIALSTALLLISNLPSSRYFFNFLTSLENKKQWQATPLVMQFFYVIGNSSKKASETSNKKGIPITKKDTLIFCREAT